MLGPHRKVNKEVYLKIYKHNNGTPKNKTTRTAINQKEISRNRPREQVGDQCSFLEYRGPK